MEKPILTGGWPWARAEPANAAAHNAPHTTRLSIGLSFSSQVLIGHIRLMLNARDLQLRIDNLAVLDDHLAVERDGAAAHRDIVMAARATVAAAFGIRAGGEQEIAGEHPGRGAHP